MSLERCRLRLNVDEDAAAFTFYPDLGQDVDTVFFTFCNVCKYFPGQELKPAVVYLSVGFGKKRVL